MARYPEARQVPARYTDGRLRAGVPYTGGPRKVIHHKTVGYSDNAPALYGGTGSWPHFTVGDNGVQQHFDTDVGSRALRNANGGVQTNSDGAIQIELVGVPGVDMSRKSCEHLAKLLKWINATHGVPWVWPSGRPKAAVKMRDPGGHNRDAHTWENVGGHYGHSQVPENTHWDPAYTDLEWYAIHVLLSS